MGTGNAGKVTGSLWRRCRKPHTMENESGPIRFEREMGNPTYVHRLKVCPFFYLKAILFIISPEHEQMVLFCRVWISLEKVNAHLLTSTKLILHWIAPIHRKNKWEKCLVGRLGSLLYKGGDKSIYMDRHTRHGVWRHLMWNTPVRKTWWLPVQCVCTVIFWFNELITLPAGKKIWVF